MIRGDVVLAPAPAYAVQMQTRGIDLFSMPNALRQTGMFGTGFIEVTPDQAERIAAILAEVSR